MSEEQIPAQSSQQLLPQPSKRKRTPSQFANQIADFKSNYSLGTKKDKNNRTNEASGLLTTNPRLNSKPQLPCLLSSGKRITLTVILEPPKPRTNKKKSKVSISPQPQKIKEDKPKEVSQTFFDKFLMVVEEFQKKDDQSKGNQASRDIGENRFEKREEKVRREKEERWNRYYDRMRNLNEKLERIVANFTFLN